MIHCWKWLCPQHIHILAFGCLALEKRLAEWFRIISGRQLDCINYLKVLRRRRRRGKEGDGEDWQGHNNLPSQFKDNLKINARGAAAEISWGKVSVTKWTLVLPALLREAKGISCQMRKRMNFLLVISKALCFNLKIMDMLPDEQWLVLEQICSPNSPL